MTLSKRERLLAVAVIAGVALLVADRSAITPLLESGAALEAEGQQAILDLEKGTLLFERRRLMAHKWQEMTAGGLASDPSEAEGRVLHAVRDWADEAGLALSSVKPERSEQEGEVGEITVLASGTGPMRSVARFLWQVETTALPLRILELQLGSRREGADDLSLQLRLSALYTKRPAPEPAGPGETS